MEIAPQKAYELLSVAHFTLHYEWDSVQRLTEEEFPLAALKISAETAVRNDDEMKKEMTDDGRFPVEILAKSAAKCFDIDEERAAAYFRTLDRYDRGSDTLPPR